MKIINDTGLRYAISKIKTLIATEFDNLDIGITEYRYTYTTPERQTVSFTVPTYTTGCTLDIYINGLYCIPDVDYTISGNVVSIVKELDGGQVCHFVVRKVN